MKKPAIDYTKLTPEQRAKLYVMAVDRLDDDEARRILAASPRVTGTLSEMAFVDAVVGQRPDLVVSAMAFRAVNGPEVTIQQETLPDLAGFEAVKRILNLPTDVAQQVFRVIYSDGDENAVRELLRLQQERDVA